FKVRNFFAAYPMTFKFDEVSVKPKYTFNKNLAFGMTDPDVKALQDILKYEGLMATNIESTSYYGSITRASVVAFQTKYGIDPLGMVGPQTRAKLNELYSG
ncbi:MAG: peptidoglycan-binding domain-containing protein, partial [Patescibacteria group bacterium]